MEELLYIFELKDLIPVDFKIEDLSETKLVAEISCIPFSPQIHKPKNQIKAVTYHNLTIKEQSGLFKTTIIFDI